jgi:DNA-binding MarR family transcriptional regulator
MALVPNRVAECASIDNPLDALLGYQLRRASAAILADLAHALEEVALTPTEASVLLLIGYNPGITQSEIGRTLAIQRANMAPIAAMLTERGLLARSQADGRSQGLVLKRAGVALADRVRAIIAAHEAKFLPELSDDERHALIAVLRRVWGR